MRTMLPPKGSLLFGYGSLRKDLGPYSYVYPELVSLGMGWAPGELHAYATLSGVWAGMLPGSERVRGEVYQVPRFLWPVLDRREGAIFDPPYYYRRNVTVKLDSGREVQAIAYFANTQLGTDVQKIPDGDWASAYRRFWGLRLYSMEFLRKWMQGRFRRPMTDQEIIDALRVVGVTHDRKVILPQGT